MNKSGKSKAAAPSDPRHPGSAPQVDTNFHYPKAGDTPKLEFGEIQGNCLGGFLKDHQANILFKITDAALARVALGPSESTSEDTNEPHPDYEEGIMSHIAASSSEAVIRFNEQFKAIRRAGLPEGDIKATWTNIAFTASGLDKLDPKREKLSAAFEEGMIKRARDIGDIKGASFDNTPANWNERMDVEVQWAKVDGILIIASDDPQELNRIRTRSRLARTLAKLDAPDSGIEVLGIIRGETREDEVGHEHFGFKDGVSQPGIRGVDSQDDALHNPDQGNPGQDMLHPGEFVIGYPTQFPRAKMENGKEVDGLNTDPGAISGKQTYDAKGEIVAMSSPFPDWANNGSFLVFRRLAQDVREFRDAVSQKAALLGLTTDLMGAKLVGRYRSGAPLEALSFQAGTGVYQPPQTDPGIANPARANSNAVNNDFEFDHDVTGEIVPLSAHIRKAYPRNQIAKHEAGVDIAHGSRSEAASESMTQTHRLLRRGIPFGKSLGAPEGGSDDNPRGLLFLAYQADIERQFEFVQKHWINDENFPRPKETVNGVEYPAAGADPIITNDSASGAIRGCPFHPQADKSKCPVSFGHFVKTRGGGYFFSPSINHVKTLLGSGE